MLKVRTNFIPARRDYFTVGKVYSAKLFSVADSDLYLVVADDGKEHVINLSCCAHLDDRAWEIVEEVDDE